MWWTGGWFARDRLNVQGTAAKCMLASTVATTHWSMNCVLASSHCSMTTIAHTPHPDNAALQHERIANATQTWFLRRHGVLAILATGVAEDDCAVTIASGCDTKIGTSNPGLLVLDSWRNKSNGKRESVFQLVSRLCVMCDSSKLTQQYDMFLLGQNYLWLRQREIVTYHL
jgi:hypothetical protein